MPVTGAPSKEQVFRDLYDAHWARVRRHVECQLENEADVDEVVNDVFAIAWQKFRPARPMGWPWLLRTADNLLRDRARHAAVEARSFESLVSVTAARARPMSPEDQVAFSEDLLVVEEAMRKLSHYERDVIALIQWREMSAVEAAKVLKSTPGAVRTALSRARSRLRRAMEKGGDDHDGS